MIAMVIDSDEKKLMQTKAYLEKRNITAVTFRDPMAAVKYSCNNDVDVVYTEVLLPHITGVDVTNLLRKQNAAVRICFLTGTDQYLHIGKKYNIAGYYIKPLLEEGQNINLMDTSKAGYG